MPYITTEVGDKTISLGFTVHGLAGNCGANLVYGMTCNATKANTRDSVWGPSSVALTKKELIEALDALWPKIKSEMQNNGFILFTDNVIAGSDLFSLGSSNFVVFKTRTFVQWLIMRGHGAVARGITSVNANHPGSSVITSWTWCPNPGRMLTLDQEFYKPSDEEINKASVDVASSYRGSLGKVAEKYNKAEAKFYEEARPKVASDSGNKAPVPGTKRGRLTSRAGVTTMRRRAKSGQKLLAQ